MNTSFPLDHAPAYVDSQFRSSVAPWPATAVGPFVTLSRESGSGGTSLARILARRLNSESAEGEVWSITEGSLTSRMLKENHLPTRIARFLPEDHISEVNASVGELVGLHPSLWDLVQKTNETMRRLARTGRAILVGRGANFATGNLPHGVHVRLVAPADFRARYQANMYDITERDALAYNSKRDAARRRFVRDTFNADVADPGAYDLVINTARVPLVAAAELIADLVRARTPVDR